MPSVRTLKIEEAKRERLERLERARKYGMAMGVQSAQQYKQRQHQIEVSLNDEIKRKLESQRAVEQTEKENIQAQNSLLRGEGLRSAQEHVAVLAARAHEESEAWRSERALTSVRADVANRIKNISRSDEESKRLHQIAAREKARQMELERSQRVLSASRATCNSAFLGVADLSKPDSSYGKVVVHQSDTTRHQSSEIVAAAVIEAKRKEQQEKQQLAVERRQEAVGRAKQIMAEKKAVEERARVAAEEEAMLRRSMVEQSMRTLKDQPSYDFQEQDARKAMHNANKARKEFEDVFLSGPWSVEQIKKFHVAPKQVAAPSSTTGGRNGEVDTSSSLFAFGTDGAQIADFFAPTSAQQLLEGTPLIGLTTDHMFAKLLIPVRDEAVGDDEHASLDGPEPEGGAPVPTPSVSSAPEPNDTTHHTITASTTNGSSLPGLPPLGPSSHNASRIPHDGDEWASDNYEERDKWQNEAQVRNTQFMQELAVFHRRLKDAQRATQAIRERSEREDEDDTETDEVHDNGDDLSVSPMSTPEKRALPTSTTTSPQRDSRSAFKVVMTSEQLRSAIKKMKAFHEQLDMSATSSEAPTTASEQPSSIPHLRF